MSRPQTNNFDFGHSIADDGTLTTVTKALAQRDVNFYLHKSIVDYLVCECMIMGCNDRALEVPRRDSVIILSADVCPTDPDECVNYIVSAPLHGEFAVDLYIHTNERAQGEEVLRPLDRTEMKQVNRRHFFFPC